MKKVLLLALLIAVAPAVAEDIYSPPWNAGLPHQTLQAWEFSDTGFAGNPLTPKIVNNPYGSPVIFDPGNHTWPVLIEGPESAGSTNTFRMDVDDSLTIWIPNNSDSELKKLIFWQITADQSPLLTGGPSTMTPEAYTGVNLSAPYPHFQHTNAPWYTYNGLIEVTPSPFGEWITWNLEAGTNITEIVIKTVSMPVPEPASLAMLTLGAVALIRRRK